MRCVLGLVALMEKTITHLSSRNRMHPTHLKIEFNTNEQGKGKRKVILGLD
jgi:hypothetical protein